MAVILKYSSSMLSCSLFNSFFSDHVFKQCNTTAGNHLLHVYWHVELCLTSMTAISFQFACTNYNCCIFVSIIFWLLKNWLVWTTLFKMDILLFFSCFSSVIYFYCYFVGLKNYEMRHTTLGDLGNWMGELQCFVLYWVSWMCWL